jgi:hypothetical protein
VRVEIFRVKNKLKEKKIESVIIDSALKVIGYGLYGHGSSPGRGVGSFFLPSHPEWLWALVLSGGYEGSFYNSWMM